MLNFLECHCLCFVDNQKHSLFLLRIHRKTSKLNKKVKLILFKSPFASGERTLFSVMYWFNKINIAGNVFFTAKQLDICEVHLVSLSLFSSTGLSSGCTSFWIFKNVLCMEEPLTKT